MLSVHRTPIWLTLVLLEFSVLLENPTFTDLPFYIKFLK